MKLNLYKNGDYYIGDAFNGLPHGKGKIFYKSNNIKFNGNFKNGKWYGKGIKYNENGDIIYNVNYTKTRKLLF